MRAIVLVFRLLGRQSKRTLGHETREKALRLVFQLVTLLLREHETAAKGANDLDERINLPDHGCTKAGNRKFNVSKMTLAL